MSLSEVNTKEHAETKLSKDQVGMRQHSITQRSLNLENNVGVVLSDFSKNILKPHTHPQHVPVNVEKELCITIHMQDKNMVEVGTVEKDDRITFPTEGLSIESACMPPESATALSSNGNEKSSPISGKESEMSQNDTKNELYSFLGGGTESCI